MSLKKRQSEYCTDIDGNKFVRVTAILESFRKMKEVRMRSGITVMDQKYHSAVASIVHDNIRNVFKEDCIFKVPPLARKKMQRMQDWRRQYSPSILLEPETPLYSKAGYAGTPDLTCVIHDHHYVVDVKTGVNIREYDLVQIEVYGHLLDEHFIGQKFRRAILQLLPDSFLFHEFEEDMERQNTFMKLLSKWRQKNEGN